MTRLTSSGCWAPAGPASTRRGTATSILRMFRDSPWTGSRSTRYITCPTPAVAPRDAADRNAGARDTPRHRYRATAPGGGQPAVPLVAVDELLLRGSLDRSGPVDPAQLERIAQEVCTRAQPELLDHPPPVGLD